MKVGLSIFIFLVMSITAFAHGGHLSTQKVTFANHKIELEFKIDRSTISHFSNQLFGENFEHKKGLTLAKYINQHFYVYLNNKKVNFNFSESNQNKHYLIVKMVTEKSNLKQGEIKIISNLFYEVDSSFQNRVIISSPNQDNTFYRLTKTNNSLTTLIDI